ncbi:unnamed protein product [Amoebophrya sp. A25]|nr:unnamed protein product [Amoebophrya sp. A25]|eukprot:GSA25T00003385001.1
MGKSGKSLINVSIIITQAGFGIAYMIFIPENTQKVLCYETKRNICPSTISISLFCVLFLLPFVFLQNMKTLVIPTLLANVSLLIGIGWGYMNAFGWTLEARSGADEIGDSARAEDRRRLLLEGSLGSSFDRPSPSTDGDGGDGKIIFLRNYDNENDMKMNLHSTLSSTEEEEEEEKEAPTSSWKDTARRYLSFPDFTPPVEERENIPVPVQQKDTLAVSPPSTISDSSRTSSSSSGSKPTSSLEGVSASGSSSASSSSSSFFQQQATATPATTAPSASFSSSTSGEDQATPAAAQQQSVSSSSPSTSGTASGSSSGTSDAVPVVASTSSSTNSTTLLVQGGSTTPSPATTNHPAKIDTSSIMKKNKNTITKKEKEQLEDVLPATLVAFNFAQYPIFFGIAVFAFEGIGLLLPCQRAMQQPERMTNVVTNCMIFLTVLFVSFGLSCYLRWGGPPSTEHGEHISRQLRRKSMDVGFSWDKPRSISNHHDENYRMTSHAAASTGSPLSFLVESVLPSSSFLHRILLTGTTSSPTTTSDTSSTSSSFPSSEQATDDSTSTVSTRQVLIENENTDVETVIGVQPMVTFNYPESTVTSFVILFYVLGIFFSYPVIMFPVFTLLENSVFIRSQLCLPNRRVISRIGKKIADSVFGGEDKFRRWSYYTEQVDDLDEATDEEDGGGAGSVEDDERDRATRMSRSSSTNVDHRTNEREAAPSSTFAITLEDDDDDDDDDDDEQQIDKDEGPSSSSSTRGDNYMNSRRSPPVNKILTGRLSPKSALASSGGQPSPANALHDVVEDEVVTPSPVDAPLPRASTRTNDSRRHLPSLNIYEKCLLRVVITFISALTALTIPHFGLFLSLLGAITCNLLAFILPAYFHYYMTVLDPMERRGTHSPLATPKEDVFYALFGIGAGLWSFGVTIAEFF